MHRLSVLLLFFCIPAAAQSVSTRIGARGAAMGNTGFVHADPSALFNNVAALAFLADPFVHFAFEKMPELPGADRRAASVSWPFSFGSLAAGAFRFGDDIYSEQILTLGLSHRIDNTALGVKTNYLQYRSDRAGTQTALTIDIAGFTQLTPNWSIGAGICNVGQAQLTPENPLPVIFIAATSWRVPDGVMLVAEVEKKLDSPLQVRGGMEVPIHKKLFARAGIGSNPLVLSGGIGAKTSRVQFDFSASYQQATSLYYQASAACRIRKEQRP